MLQSHTTRTLLRTTIVTAGTFILAIGNALAHCDSTQGPVIPEARAALEQGDVTPVLKWVRVEDEPEIRQAFERALSVRSMSDEAKELADRYFLETLIRVHRAGEGAPFTGINDDPIAPILTMADRSLARHDAEEMIGQVGAHMARAILERFDRVVEASKHKDESVEAGRAYVEAYVNYMHYVEAVHDAIVSSVAHHSNGHMEPHDE